MKLIYVLAILIILAVGYLSNREAIQDFWSAETEGGSYAVAAGELTSVDAEQNTLTLEREGATQGSQAFLVDASTEITDGRRDLEVTDLEPGDQLRVLYAEHNGSHRAHEIVLTQQASSASPSGAK
jgi:hypothetical protein